MNSKVLIYALFAVLTISACNSAEKPTDEAAPTEETVQSELEKAWDAVMVVHDEVMPKMSDLNRLKKELMQDTVKNAEMIEMITKAQDGMMDWMHNLKPLNTLKAMPETEAKTYLDGQMTSVTEVKRMMLERIEKAENELQK